MTLAQLSPLPVVIPLSVAALLALAVKKVPRRLADTVSLFAAAAATACSLLLAWGSRDSRIVYWFGGWVPHGQVAVGISFAIDPFGAGLAALSGLLTFAALVFALRYFDSAGALVHVLMLVFLAALDGFGLTGDLFNLFVFFELMSAAAFALCGYKSEEKGPLQGAFNFGVTNTVGAFFVLTGIGLLYGRTGALNMAQIGHMLGGRHDGLVIAAFTLITVGFLVKTAAVPFHLWLPDAHAVAPTPVCVLFSGVMVEAGLYAVARLYVEIFSRGFASHLGALREILLALAVLTAVVGAVMCFVQHHLKRLLAFSTISHVGLMLTGVALFSPGGFSGAALYVVGHGLVKSSLFLCAGLALHCFRTVDERLLQGKGRHALASGVVFAVGALALAGLPPFGTFIGMAQLEHAAELEHLGGLAWVAGLVGALTGGAVLRVALRTYWGLGEPLKDEGSKAAEHGVQDEAPETKGGDRRPPSTMFLAAAGLLALGLVLGLLPQLRAHAEAQAAQWLDPHSYALRVLTGLRAHRPPLEPEAPLLGSFVHSLITVLAVVALALFALFPRRLGVVALGEGIAKVLSPLRRLHSGHVGDYVAWLVFGVACFGGVCAIALR